MNKLRSTIGIILCVGLITLLLNSCENPTDPDKHELVGTWKSTTYTMGGQTYACGDATFEETITFKDDYRFQSSGVNQYQTINLSGTWSTSDHILKCISQVGTTEGPYTVSGNTFTWTVQQTMGTLTVNYTKQ